MKVFSKRRHAVATHGHLLGSMVPRSSLVLYFCQQRLLTARSIHKLFEGVIIPFAYQPPLLSKVEIVYTTQKAYSLT